MKLSEAERLLHQARRLRHAGILAGTSGNLSLRLGPGQVLITSSGGFKDEQTAEDLLVVDLIGHRLSGSASLSSEGRMHLALYRRAPLVQAIVHAHPAHATAIGCAEPHPDLGITAEGVAALGPVVRVPWVIPGGEELAEAAARAVRFGWTLLLAHHGAVACGSSIEDAAARMESLERSAEICTVAVQHGRCRMVPDADRRLLLEQYGWQHRVQLSE